MENEKFESWVVIELFGHQQIAGKASEATIGGCPFLRVDVPESKGRPACTKFYGSGAIDAAVAIVKTSHRSPQIR